MNKLNKNGLIKAACFMLIVMWLSLCVISGTMAKYTSTGEANKLTVSVAKWSILVGVEEEYTESDEEEKDLAQSATIDLSGLTWNIMAEEGITTGLAGNEDNIIGPGTWGYVEIRIVNNSDVDADVTISGFSTFLPVPDEDYSNDNLTFMVVESDSPPSSFGDGKEVSDDEIEFPLEKAGDTTSDGGSKSFYVYYKWVFAEDDTANSADTDMANKTDDERILNFGTLTITATQKHTTT